jgi:hypothetical protein
MRLPLLPPATLSADQKDLYDDMVAVIETNFGELVARRQDGALIGPFNGWLHFPQFGRPAWALPRWSSLSGVSPWSPWCSTRSMCPCRVATENQP